MRLKPLDDFILFVCQPGVVHHGQIVRDGPHDGLVDPDQLFLGEVYRSEVYQHLEALAKFLPQSFNVRCHSRPVGNPKSQQLGAVIPAPAADLLPTGSK